MTDEVQLTEEELTAQDEAEFLAATKGEELPEREEAPEPEVTAEAAPEATPEVTPEADDEDEFANIPASVIEKLEAKLAGAIEQKLSGRLRNIEGHIGGLKHNLTQLSTAAKAAETQGAEAPSKAQIREAASSGEKLTALKADFPEWADALEESLEAMRQQTPQVDMNAINQRIESTEQATEKAMNRARQLARLDMAHPGWEQDIQSDQYRNWLYNQPPEVQALTTSENAADAMRVLDAYRDATTASQPDLTAQSRQKNRLEAAITPTTGGQTTRRQPKTEHEEFIEAFGRR